MPYALRAVQEMVGGELTFAEHERYLAQGYLTRAYAIITAQQYPGIEDRNFLRVANPRAAFVRLIGAWSVGEKRQ